MNYFTYLLKAKGRHGTHSPFIYNLVENALHEPAEQQYPSGIKSKDAQQLFRALDYLCKDKIWITPELLTDNKWLQSSLPIALQNEALQNSTSFVFLTDVNQIEFFLNFSQPENWRDITIVVLHKGNNAYPLMQSLYALPVFNCTVFAWHFSILKFSKDFKRKQHFVLR